MQAGMADYWGNYFDYNNIPISINFSSSSSCNTNGVEVIRSNLSGTQYDNGGRATVTSNAQGDAKIEIDTDVTGNDDVWKGFGAHELGHILDYDNAASNCTSNSIMADPFVWNGPSMQCGDQNANQQRWSSSGDENWEPSVHEEDCWDVYWVQITYCHAGGNNWVQCGYRRTFLGTDCTPPI